MPAVLNLSKSLKQMLRLVQNRRVGRLLIRGGLLFVLLFWYLSQVVDFVVGVADFIPRWAWGLGLIILSTVATAVWFESVRGKLAPEWPDYTRWDGIDELELYQAAMLWCDYEPKLPMKRDARQKYLYLRQLIIEDGIPIEKETKPLTVEDAVLMMKLSSDDEYNVNARIKRGYLRLLAERLGERPRFLFKEERA